MRKMISFFFVMLAPVVFAATAFSFSPEPFSQEKFDSAQKSGKVVLIDVYAKWCPTCKRQHADLKKFLTSEKYKDLVVYQVDFDKKDDVKTVQKIVGKPIPRQSTIAIYKGLQLVAFSVAETGDTLKKQIDKAYQ